MTPQEITAKANAIRALISDNDLELANKKLVELTKKSVADHWDEALTISANRERLEVKERNGLLTPVEADVIRNQLIDRMLELTRAIEKGMPLPPPPDEKKRAIWWIWPLMGTILVAGLVWFYMQDDTPIEEKKPIIETTETPANTTCETLFETGKKEFSNNQLTEAYASFVKVRKNCPEMQPDANKWLQIVAKQQAIEQRTNTPPEVSEESQAANRAKTSTQAYARFMNAGDAAAAKKQYDQALTHYREARKINDTMEAARGENQCIEKLYRNWFSKGMNAWNAERYPKATWLFEKAQAYKNTLQVQNMIKKAERKASE